jgi:hypothetical protein
MTAVFPVLTAAQTLTTDTPALVTDRPDFTESSDVVGRGVVQIETGSSFESDGEGGAATRTLTMPQALARIGLGRRVELRLGSDGFVAQSLGVGSDGARTSGYADAEVGVKVRLVEGVAGFDMAVIPMMSMPTGRTGFSSEGYDPTLKITWAHDLMAGFGLSGNFNFASTTEAGNRNTERTVSLSLDHDFGKAWGAYWESYGTFAGGACACTVNSGITRAVGPNMQADIEVGRGVTSSAPDWFVGVGFAIRHLGR